MKKTSISQWISTFAAPVVTIIGGLILLFSPDMATALLATTMGWGFLTAGIVLSIFAFAGNRGVGAILRGLGFVAVGLWLTRNPMSLAVAFGKLLGIGLMIGAIGGYRKSRSSAGRTIYLAEGALALVLLVAPLTATRTVYIVMGLILVAAGILMLLNKVKNNNRLGPGDGVIDV